VRAPPEVYSRIGMERARRWAARLRTLPPLVSDAGLAGALAVGALAELHLGGGPSAASGLDTRPLVVLLLTLPLAVRRRHPLVCAVLQLLGSGLIRVQPPYTAVFALLVGVYSLCVYGPTPWLPLAWVMGSAAALQVFLPDVRVPLMPSVQVLLGGMVAWLGGQAARQRQAQARMLQERAERLEMERELTAQLAIANERRRIARELHDVVAHRVSLIVIQAGAARTVRGQPPRAVAALRQVEASGRQALVELRQLVGLLGDEQGSELAPRPGLAQLEQLARTVGSAGLPVALQITGPRRALPPGLDLTIYRIVQEALTNSLKHAPGAAAEVHVDFGDQELQVEVLDTGARRPGAPPPSGGRGLMGMRERVAVHGGQLEAGPRAEGGFRVRARLPVPPA